ncbi:hypothetical protein jhhlp_005398 [Lomentospora prolificans]|uniref:Methyltransferase domain-containing protein n=1 Tax=Lomentospora prolificans TaxID=41688 RepID=A0A2N3N6P8_9PEZI|nr:hypothetical protein jhhlp_005398 [Lomentospora prolificans]
MDSTSDSDPTAGAADSSAKPSTSLPEDGFSSCGIAVDPNHGDADSNEERLGATVQNSAMSLSESIMEFRKIYGRTFHNFNSDITQYWGPNDEKQNDHLDTNHAMLLIAMDNELFYSPIGDNPERVIDIGTGTGVWAVDFADQFPSAEVIGTDLSPIQPSWVPPNCKFELDDAQLPWDYPDNYFDFVHMRLMMGSIKDWPALYREAYRCLKPGGWIEHLDYDPRVMSDDGTIGPDSPWAKWGELFIEAGEKLQQSFSTVIDHNSYNLLQEAGFENVQERRLKLPLGSWPADPKWKAVGQLNLAATEKGLEGFALYILTHVHGWGLEETQVFLAFVRKELKNRKKHGYYMAASVFGQKPMD